MIHRPTAAPLRVLLPLLALALFTAIAHGTPTAAEIDAAPQLEATLPASSAATTPANPVWKWHSATDQLVEIVLQLSSSSSPPTAFNVYTGHDTTTPLPVSAGRFSASAGTTYIFAAETAHDTQFTLVLRQASPFSTWLHSLTPTQRSRSDIPDLHKFAFAIDPSTPAAPAHPNYPAPRVVGDHLELVYTLRAGDLSNSTGTVTVEGQVSADGKNWTPVDPQPLGDNTFVLRTPIDPNTPTKQLRLAVHSSEPARTTAPAGVSSQWATNDPAAAAAWAQSLEPGSPSRGDLLREQWTRGDPGAAAAWLESLRGDTPPRGRR